MKQNITEVMLEWENFTTKELDYYSLYIDDYVNDLSLREIIEEHKSALDKGQRKKLDICDNLYMNRTEKIKEAIININKSNQHFWLYSRIPKNPGELLKKDLAKYL